MPVQALRTSVAAAALIGLPFAAQAAGMPQFDLTRFPTQIFWLVVCFAVLYFLMAKAVLPKIGATIMATTASTPASRCRSGVRCSRCSTR